MLSLHPMHVQEGPRPQRLNRDLEAFPWPSPMPEDSSPSPREHREIEREDAAGPAQSPNADTHADIEPSPAPFGILRRTGKVHADSRSPPNAPSQGVHASLVAWVKRKRAPLVAPPFPTWCPRMLMPQPASPACQRGMGPPQGQVCVCRYMCSSRLVPFIVSSTALRPCGL